MMEEVLDAVVRHGARFMIVDLTGAQAADTSTIDHLLRIFAATRLLGSRCIVSGVPTAMVGRILESGGSLDGIPVFSTLKSALEHAGGRDPAAGTAGAPVAAAGRRSARTER